MNYFDSILRFKYVHHSYTFEKFNGHTITIDGKLYEIDIYPLHGDDPDSRMWIRARRVYDSAMFCTEKNMMEGFQSDKKVETALFEIKRRIFEDLVEMGYARPVEEFSYSRQLAE